MRTLSTRPRSGVTPGVGITTTSSRDARGGDVVRGIDWLGNAGFVRNVIEKARDHRKRPPVLRATI